MTTKYDHNAIERKWTKVWERKATYQADLSGATRPYYNLMMFPYPSAEGLHIGNTYAYIGSDVHGRFMRSQGYDVFEPMGFDAFGVHSENYAIKTGVNPARLVPETVDRFRKQLKRLGCMSDWSHEVNTTDPKYYRWVQWIFVQLYKAGLAYRAEAPVNWCPSCKTVLADEQAEGGDCERCGARVESRNMQQWFLRITAYAQKLLDNLDRIDWSSTTKSAQRQWIGRSEGAEVRFPVPGSSEEIAVFTTRPDTLWGATYMVLAPEHPLVDRITTSEQREHVLAYLATVRARADREREASQREKTGVFTGAYAINPVKGSRIPIWVSDYGLMGYGSGAIMAVPAHDARDFAFARQFGLPIVQVVSPDGSVGALAEAYVGEGVLIQSGPFSGMGSEAARRNIPGWLAERGIGQWAVHYHLRDWCISRQRYWGPPIPIVYCEECGALPVPEEQLPVLLPVLERFEPDGSGKSPLGRLEGFANTSCPQCGGRARRETDVSDNFLDSAWYFFRYPSFDRDDVPFDRELTEKWLPVDMYMGGNEHAVLHLMYTRFLTMAFKTLGLVSFEEPFKCFRANGVIVKDGEKMSKSKPNVVSPDKYIERYGADTLRTYLMFMAPFQEGGNFRDAGVVGVRRFLDRLWRYVAKTKFSDEPVTDPAILRKLHQTVRKVTNDIQELRYNTAIAAIMDLLNSLVSQDTRHLGPAKTLVQLSCPFAPFIAQELWERTGGEGMIADVPWPGYDLGLAREEVVEVVVQVNGKVRARLRLPVDLHKAEVERAALANPKVRRSIEGKKVIRTVFVPNRILNIVVMDSGS